MLQLTHPETAARTCDVCLRWMFDLKSGRLIRNRETGEPIARLAGCRPPCLSCVKCTHATERTPESGRYCDLSRRNQLTLTCYYQQQAAPGPTDDVMRRNFGVIYEVLTNYDRSVQQAALMVKKVS
jgi:hypothetical protein